MRQLLRLLLLVGLFLVGKCPGNAQAATSIDFFTVDGGGGSSSGGQYNISGTFGQPDAGFLAGGNYTIAAGFWGIAGIDASDVPALTISAAGGSITICWPSPSTGYVLEQLPNGSPGSANWVPVSQTPSDNGVIKCVTVPRSPGTALFRLRKPLP